MTMSQAESTPLTDSSAQEKKGNWRRNYLVVGIILFIIVVIIAVIIGVTETMNSAAF